MSSSPGMIFMLAVLIVGFGVLAGGYVWVYAGLPWLGVIAGIAGAGFLAFALSAFAKRASAERRVRFLGESSDLDENDFVDVVAMDDDGPRAQIEKDVQRRPERVAGSIQSILARGRRDGRLNADELDAD